MDASVKAFTTDSATPRPPLEDALASLRQAFVQEPMPSPSKRKQWLRALKAMLLDNQQAFIAALDADFRGRSADDTLLAEIMPSVQGINHALRHLRSWMRSQWRFPGLALMPASARVMYQPLGVVGIVVPWNYPLFLAFGPLVAALAAGNRVLIKMPEHTPQTSALFAEVVQRYLGNNLVIVVNGGPEVAEAFCRQPFDHLLFTGSTRIGQQVMAAAAQHLTPVTLELGGKSPAIIGDDINLDLAAERICFGKSLNAGQTCVAPDYVLIQPEREAAFIAAYQRAFARMYPKGLSSSDYTSLINGRQSTRIQQLVEEAEAAGARLTRIGEGTISQRPAPVLVSQCPDHCRLLQEEIFGPVLPLVHYRKLDEAIAYINARPRPLALYLFTHQRSVQKQVLEQTHSGGVCLNDTILHVAAEDLPFGGVGASGMGHYHGREGFITFSKAKAIFAKGRLNAARLVYPPYHSWLNRLVYWLFIR